MINEKEFNRVFSANLRKYLSMNRMTQSDLAKRLNVSDNTVSNWARGNKSPRMDKLDAMCKIFGCRRSDLMEEHTSYYLNPETDALAQELFDNPDLRMLFDAGRNATPEQLRMAAEMLRMFKAGNSEG